MPKLSQDLIRCFQDYQEFFEVVDVQEEPTKINLLCRVYPNNEGKWLEMTTKVLRALEGTTANAHVCKNYFLKEGKLVYGARLIISHTKLVTPIGIIARAFGLKTLGPKKSTKKEVRPMRMAQTERKGDTPLRNRGPQLDEIALRGGHGARYPRGKGINVVASPDIRR